jgi:hypothetical protein
MKQIQFISKAFGSAASKATLGPRTECSKRYSFDFGCARLVNGADLRELPRAVDCDMLAKTPLRMPMRGRIPTRGG